MRLQIHRTDERNEAQHAFGNELQEAMLALACKHERDAGDIVHVLAVLLGHTLASSVDDTSDLLDGIKLINEQMRTFACEAFVHLQRHR